jgi:O-antigen ligase
VSGAVESIGVPLRRSGPWIPAVIVGFALLVGLALGDPSPGRWAPIGLLGLGVIFYVAVRWPFASLLVMISSAVLLVVVRVVGLRSVNLIDLLLPPVLITSLLGARRSASAKVETGAGHDHLTLAERGLTRWVIVFYSVATLSLFRLATLAGTDAALDSGLYLIRAFQALLFYPLCMWWLRDSKRIDQAWQAIVIAGIALFAVNIAGVAFWEVKRAGMAFFLNNWDAPLASPNEAGTASLIVAAALIIRHLRRPHPMNLVFALLMILLLGLSQSRSGILAWMTFGLFTLRWVRPMWIVTGLLTIGAALPLLPQTFWGRMARSIALDRPSFEAYSILVRIYGWRTAWDLVRDHPFIGVGYLGYRFVSHLYNQFGIVLTTVENYYYEVLVSMGVVGLAVLAVVIVKLYQLGSAVGRVAPPGTLAHYMARFHGPLLTALLVANLTADNFMGMAGLAQLAIWTAVLVRSAHVAVASRAPA